MSRGRAARPAHSESASGREAGEANSPEAQVQPDSADEAQSRAAAFKAVADAPDVREDRVNALKAAVADGSYEVDSRALATKLLGTSDA